MSLGVYGMTTEDGTASGYEYRTGRRNSAGLSGLGMALVHSLMAHGMIEIAAFLFDTTTAALRLVFDGVYDRNPDFKFIVPHAGSLIPYFVGRIDHFGAARRGSTGQIHGPASDHIRKFYVDTVCNWSPAVQLCLDFFGEDRVMLGSDHPFWPMPLAKKTLDDLRLADGVRSKVEHLNAARLFRLQVPTPEAR